MNQENSDEDDDKSLRSNNELYGSTISMNVRRKTWGVKKQ
jgi:hypothetical protein